ncbi:esterase-like activity of phytase family protein [Streptomyces fuscigenes]|uniref:esterase-like activity of phytase family protein n=1 Tax=Streptomyces fuscigenes TaxID=1528880 RepID=UPI001F3A8410|nr:esterase-like activity of phytase family protein [Streptomyces fuscigenes]MCF3963111.1 esterase-like activity of phytase family protein [Streptomyces fuscigenes]
MAAVLVVLPSGGRAFAEGRPDQDFTIKDPRITESSGLAASRLHPGVYWTHNDSGDGPYIYAVDSRTGETVARVTLRGVGSPRDVEAISLGPDGDLYVGDIGDNLDGAWDHVWIYRFPEPKRLGDQSVDATQFTVKYADGPRNAESLMVDPTTGRVYIASKNEDGGGLYEGPARLTATGTNVFRRIARVPWVTDGAFSPDGKRLVLRSYLGAYGYAWKDGRPGATFPVSAPFQQQSESVTFTRDGKALMFGSEGRDSEVKRVDLKGESGGSDSGRGAGSASGAARGDGSGRTSGTSSSGSGGHVTVGLVVVVAVLLLVFGVRKRSRKSP